MNPKTKKVLKWSLSVFLIIVTLEILHEADKIHLDRIYFKSDKAPYLHYEALREDVHYALWIWVAVIGAMSGFTIIQSGKLRWTAFTKIFLYSLAIMTWTELPVFPCYTSWFEPFWMGLHLH